MPLSKSEKILIASAFVTVAVAGYIDGVYASGRQERDVRNTLAEAVMGISKMMPYSINVIGADTIEPLLHPVYFDENSGTQSIGLDPGEYTAEFDFAKNQICLKSLPSHKDKKGDFCMSMAGADSDLAQELKDNACLVAARSASETATVFSQRHCD